MSNIHSSARNVTRIIKLSNTPPHVGLDQTRIIKLSNIHSSNSEYRFVQHSPLYTFSDYRVVKQPFLYLYIRNSDYLVIQHSPLYTYLGLSSWATFTHPLGLSSCPTFTPPPPYTYIGLASCQAFTPLHVTRIIDCSILVTRVIILSCQTFAPLYTQLGLSSCPTFTPLNVTRIIELSSIHPSIYTRISDYQVVKHSLLYS